MDLGVIITAIIGVATSFTSAWVSWFFTRKKYSAEVDQNVIDNMAESLEFYKKLSDDNRVRLENLIRRNNELEKEVNELRGQVFKLMVNICYETNCSKRKQSITE